jgi:CysZ protein
MLPLPRVGYRVTKELVVEFAKNLVVGVALPFQAAKLVLRNPKTWPWVLLPIFVTIAVYYWLWSDVFIPWQNSISEVSVHALAGLFGVESSESLKSGLRSLINVLLATFFWIVALLSFSSLSNIATLPVNDFLAEAVEPLCNPPLARDFPSGVAAFFGALWVDLRKSLFAAAVMVVTFFFSWIPIMNFVAIGLVALALTFQYIGYATTRRGMGVRASIGVCFRNLALSFGLGLSCMVLLSIPFIKLVIPPLAVIAGTMMFARITNPPKVG